jgi:phenylpropionate dioxygenase-like ring-hydroxylating dioxygenase large terminal subunit
MMTGLLAAIAPTCQAPSPARATTLPPEAYGSDELFALESEKVLRANWIPLCRVEQVETPGSYRSIDVLSVPLVVTRDRDGEIHVLSRTCRHRWMEVATGSGVAPALQCPYHLWTYGLDGHLAGAPEMGGAEGFCRDDVALTSYRHEVWQGFVMVNLDGRAEPVAEQLAGLDAYVEPYGLADYRTVEATDWGICPWDWKIMVDNFMECYHHMGPHRESLEDLYPARQSTIDAGGPHYSVMWSNPAPGALATAPFLDPEAAPSAAEPASRSLIFIAYPLLQVVVGPGFMYWLQTLPVGPGRIELHMDIAMSPAALVAPDAEVRREALVDSIVAVHREDLDVCAAVQRAVVAGAEGTGRLSLLEQALWEFYRYLGRELGLPDTDFVPLVTPAPGQQATAGGQPAEEPGRPAREPAGV